MVITQLTCFAVRKAIEYINFCFGLFFSRKVFAYHSEINKTIASLLLQKYYWLLDITIELALFPEKILTSCHLNCSPYTFTNQILNLKNQSENRRVTKGYPATQIQPGGKRAQEKCVAVTRNQTWVRRKSLSLSKGVITCWQLEFTWLLIQ